MRTLLMCLTNILRRLRRLKLGGCLRTKSKRSCSRGVCCETAPDAIERGSVLGDRRMMPRCLLGALTALIACPSTASCHAVPRSSEGPGRFEAAFKVLDFKLSIKLCVWVSQGQNLKETIAHPTSFHSRFHYLPRVHSLRGVHPSVDISYRT